MRRSRVKRRRKVKGRGIQRPYVNKRNRLMLGKGKNKKVVLLLQLLQQQHLQFYRQ